MLLYKTQTLNHSKGRFDFMRFSILVSLFISSVCFSQIEKGQFGLMQINEFNSRGGIGTGIGITHFSNNKSLSLRISRFSSYHWSAGFKEAQLFFKQYLIPKERRIDPFLTAGFGFYRGRSEKKIRDTSFFDGPTNACDPSDPCNIPVNSTYVYWKYTNNITVFIGGGTDLKLNDSFFFTLEVLAAYRDIKTMTYWYVGEPYRAHSSQNMVGREKWTADLHVGIIYKFKPGGFK